MKTHRTTTCWRLARLSRTIPAALSLCAISSATGETLLQEDFNTDGSAGPNPRYTITGSFLSEAPHDPVDVPNAPDQLGPVFWGRNSEASFVGVPAPTKGRRALLAWDGALVPGSPTGGASPEMMQLIANAVKWLAKEKPNATIAFSPNMAIAQPLADHLAQLGYVIVDDDRVTSDTAYPADAIIKGPDGEFASRFANAPQGVLAFGAIEHDDMLTSSIGSVANFQSGPATVVNPAHPAAAGVPAGFTAADVPANWNLMGDTLPGGAITIATMVRVIPQTVANLADVDAMAAGTKPAAK
jgi:hypothetical protein